MQTGTGTFIALEGTDGAGKATQTQLLAERLTRDGHEVAVFDFPRYGEPSSYFVREYLNGKYGAADGVGPYTASLFYALDRFAAAQAIREAVAAGKVVLANRFTGSNMAHQGTKFSHAEERRGFFIWLDNLEFEMLHIPRPRLSLVLRVPAATAQKRVDQKSERSYTSKKRDLHEADLSHLERSVAVYDDLCQLFPKDFMRIDCVRGGKLMDVNDVHTLVWGAVEPLLPAPPQRTSAATVAPTVITEVAEPKNNGVAAANDEAAAKDAGSAGTRRKNDTADKLPPAPAQTIHFASASSLLVKQLEQAGAWLGKPDFLAAEPSLAASKTAGNRPYTTPAALSPAAREYYHAAMDKLFALHADIAQRLTAYLIATDSTPKAQRDAAWHAAIAARTSQAVRAVLPVAAATPVRIVTPAWQATTMIAEQLRHSPLPEARAAAEQMAALAPPGPAAVPPTQAYQSGFNHLLQTALPAGYAGEPSKPVRLLHHWPRNEFDLLPFMAFDHTTAPVPDLQTQFEQWPYEQKLAAFTAYAAMAGGTVNAFARANYTWEIVASFAALFDMPGSASITWQPLTPRFGYAMPPSLDAAGLAGYVDTCFDLSLQLHSRLQRDGYEAEAQYATLFGHKQRWLLQCNAASEIFTQGASQGNADENGSLIAALQTAVANVHPLTAEALWPKDR